jgi:predicted nuclease of predicted toxin-antitoxin system
VLVGISRPAARSRNRSRSFDRNRTESRPLAAVSVVSKDDNFRSLPLVNGAPQKIIWLRIGNGSTDAIEAFIRSALVKIRTFEISPEESLLVLP